MGGPYVRRSMRYIQPQSLSDNEVYAVTAYLLNTVAARLSVWGRDREELDRVVLAENAGRVVLSHQAWAFALATPRGKPTPGSRRGA